VDAVAQALHVGTFTVDVLLRVVAEKLHLSAVADLSHFVSRLC
jgi:hypothetical protein